MTAYFLTIEYMTSQGHYGDARFPLEESDLGQILDHVKLLSLRHLPTGSLVLGGRLDRQTPMHENVH